MRVFDGCYNSWLEDWYYWPEIFLKTAHCIEMHTVHGNAMHWMRTDTREPTLQWLCHHIIPVQLKLEWCVIFSRDMCSAHIIVHYVHLNWSCITILLLLHLNFSSPSSFAALTFALIFALIFAQLNLKVTSSHHSSPPHTIIFNSENNISFYPYL